MSRTVVLAAAISLALAACSGKESTPVSDAQKAPAQQPAEASTNPLLSASTLPFQAPQFDKIKDADFAPAFDAGMACVHVLFIRHGKILGTRNYFPSFPAGSAQDELLHAFVLQFYLAGQSGRQIPSEVLVDCQLDDEAALAAVLSDAAGYQVRVANRTRAERARYLKLASTNAKVALSSHLSHRSTLQQRMAQLEEVPHRAVHPPVSLRHWSCGTATRAAIWARA